MPRFVATETNEVAELTSSRANSFTQLVYWKVVLVMVFIYYALACGLEAIYQVKIVI